MRKNVVVLVVILLVGAGVVVFLRGQELWGPGGGAYERDEAEGGDGDFGGDPSGSGAGAEGREGDAVRDAVLFGRPRERLEGAGVVLGKVALAETGEPVPGASLILAGQAFEGAPVSVRARTDDDGSFQLTDVPGGDVYALRILAPDLPERTLPDIRVLPGSVARLGTIWLGAKAGFEGRVVDAADRPVAGADVRVHAGSFSLMDLMGNFSELFATLDREPEPVARTKTRSDGTFAFEALDPGSMMFVVRASGHAPGQRSAVVPPAGSQKHPLVIRLGQGTEVTGRVVDAAGHGIGGARVAVVGLSDPSSFLYGRVFTSTESDGRFRVDTAGAGSNTMLLAAATGFPTTSHKIEANTKDVKIVLRRGASVTFRFLTEPDDAPLEGASVFFVVGDEADISADDRQTFSGGKTDRFGEVQVDTRPGKLQMMWVQHPDRATGMWMGGATGQMVPGVMRGPEDPTIQPGQQEMVFRLRQSFIVRGRITGPNGEPVVGARVASIGGLSFGRPAISGADGTYELHSTTSPQMGGFMALVVTADGYVQDEESMTVDASALEGGVLVHDVEMDPAGVVSGRVLDAVGAPVVGAQVRVNSEGGMGSALFMFDSTSGITGPGGRYVLDGVPPGEGIRVLARHPAFVDGASEPFDVRGGASKSGMDVVLRSGRTLEVDVTGPGGGALSGAKVEFSYRTEIPVEWDFLESLGNDAARLTDARGRVRERRVPTGTAIITASHPDYAATKKEVEVGEGAPPTVSVTIALQTAATASGRVVDATGKPLPSASVIASPAGENAGPPHTTSTSEDGTFRIDRLPAGETTLRVRAAGHRVREETVRAPAANLEIRLSPLDPDVEKRREEIMQRMGELGMAYQNTENDAEREALTEEIRALQRELGELQQDQR